jgi:hypothetical protein
LLKLHFVEHVLLQKQKQLCDKGLETSAIHQTACLPGDVKAIPALTICCVCCTPHCHHTYVSWSAAQALMLLSLICMSTMRHRCWAADLAQRPCISKVLDCLHAMIQVSGGCYQIWTLLTAHRSAEIVVACLCVVLLVYDGGPTSSYMQS